MAVRGRKRKLGERYPCGKIRVSQEELDRRMTPRAVAPDDLGTPETQARRVAVFGSVKIDGELQCPIGVLSNRLSTEQRWAAKKGVGILRRHAVAIRAPRLVAGQLTEFIQGNGAEAPANADALRDAVTDYDHLKRTILAEVRHRYRFNNWQGKGACEPHPGAVARQAFRELLKVAKWEMPSNFHALCLALDAIIEEYDLKDDRIVEEVRDAA